MDIFSVFRKLKKPKSQPQGLDLELASPTTEETISELKKAKFRLRRPRVTSPTEKRIVRKKPSQSLQSSAASTTSSEVIRAGSPFADEDDLFADRDDGVYMQSSSSSASPAASERLVMQRPKSRSGLGGQLRPASCTFGAASGIDAKFGTTFHPHNARGKVSILEFQFVYFWQTTQIFQWMMKWNLRWHLRSNTGMNCGMAHLYVHNEATPVWNAIWILVRVAQQHKVTDSTFV